MEKKFNLKELSLDILFDIIAGFLQAIGLHCFINSIDIAPGGATGLAIIFNRLTGLPIGTLNFMINGPLLIASWIWLGKSMTLKTFKTVAIISFIIDVIVTPYVPIYVGDKIISCIAGAVLVGASLAVVFVRGSTTGGGDIMAKLLQKFRPHLPTNTAIMMTDFVIIGTSILVFRNIDAGLYGLLNMYLGSYIIELMLYGPNKSTMITVMSSHVEEIAEELMDFLERGCTYYKSEGAFSKREGKTLICVVDKKQFHKAKKIIYGIDPTAFLIVSEAKEVYGEGFLHHTWEV